MHIHNLFNFMSLQTAHIGWKPPVWAKVWDVPPRCNDTWLLCIRTSCRPFLSSTCHKHASMKRGIWQQTVTPMLCLGLCTKKDFIAFLRSVVCLWFILLWRKLSLVPLYSSYDLRLKKNKVLKFGTINHSHLSDLAEISPLYPLSSWLW